MEQDLKFRDPDEECENDLGSLRRNGIKVGHEFSIVSGSIPFRAKLEKNLMGLAMLRKCAQSEHR
jgi:hypothetical protein